MSFLPGHTSVARSVVAGGALLGSVLAGAAFGAQDETATTVVELDDVALKELPWTPRDPWRPMGRELVLADQTFAVELNERSHLRIDTTGDGRPETRVTGMGGVETLKWRDEDGESFRYWIRIERIGRDWRWRPAGSRAGRLAGEPIAIVDFDGDGRYGDYGVDLLLVGRERRVSLLSRVVSVDDALYSLEVAEDGRSAEARPYAGPRARLDVTSEYATEGELTRAVFSSGAEISFDLAGVPGGLEVPTGTYELVAARVEKGSESASVRPGRMEPVTLAEGDQRALEWGGPLTGEFTAHHLGTLLTVAPDVSFLGTAGEEYFAFAPEAEPPRIEVRDRASGDLLQYGHLGGLCGGGFSACVLEVPADAELEIVLAHRRALFGDIVGHPRR